ncbi:uncharacterized protein LOC133795966 [Humulus lupulus]|uniref:uncharacterized protein LOC133795966 n=1 Tax=Humulus lupulus TaxID=3486 RepID=UPI002B417B63|nr:uncharacterized protein LOC133795966 [Humulus lupulus]
MKEFYGHFYVGRVHPTEANQLVDILQKEGEALKGYIQQFMQAAVGAKTVGDEGKMMTPTVGVRHHSFLWHSLRKNGVKCTQEFLDRADRYIKLKEAIANEGKSPTNDQGKKEDPTKAANGLEKTNSNGKNNGKNGGKRVNHKLTMSDNKCLKQNRYEPRFTNYTALVDSKAEVCQASHTTVPFRQPTPIRKDIIKRDTTKFCHFHNDYSHDTIGCNQLKDEIEFLIRQGHLRRYVLAAGGSQQGAQGGNE